MTSHSRKPKTFRVQACAQCRAHKTRCELLDVDIDDVKCHRCGVLRIRCSYADMEVSIFQPFITSHQSPRAAAAQPKPPTGFDKTLTLIDQTVHHQTSAIPPPSMGFGEIPAHFALDPALAQKDGKQGNPLFGFFKTLEPVDWNHPLTAIEKLVKPRVPIDRLPLSVVAVDHDLESILSRDQVEHLYGMFLSDFQPWLSFPGILDENGSTLEIVCCTVAARHLELQARSTILPRLQKLTDSTISRILFNGPSAGSLEAIQALLIVSLWPPIVTESTLPDSQVLLGAAVSMAMNQQISTASTKLLQMQASNYATAEEISDLTGRARLWTSLTNMESLLCLGTARTPLSRRSAPDRRFIPHSVFSPSTLIECRDSRIKFLAEIFTCTETAATIQLLDPARLDAWYDEFMRSLGPLDAARRLIYPLEAVSDHDRFYFHMLLLTLHSCRIQVLYRAFNNIRILFTRQSPLTWFSDVKPHGMNVLVTWGREVGQLAEVILVNALQTDARLLSTTPDAIFSMIAFAAALCVGVKSFLLTHRGLELPGSTDNLLRLLVGHLDQASLYPGDAPSSCARFFAMMLATLQTERENVLQKGPGPPVFQNLNDTFPFGPVRVEAGSRGLDNLSPSPGDIFGDTTFWAQLFQQESDAFPVDLQMYKQMEPGQNM
ncbi:hypothetical protein C8J56DRAFT_486269 [Mycena floridula]|nr:hypothetical protein C8J56DRAFT_486269 [Mycena floridula]